MELPPDAVSAENLEISLAADVENRQVHMVMRAGETIIDLGPVKAKVMIPKVIMAIVNCGEIGDRIQADVDAHPEALLTDIMQAWDERLNAPHN